MNSKVFNCLTVTHTLSYAIIGSPHNFYYCTSKMYLKMEAQQICFDFFRFLFAEKKC